jgi:hypothetical protein
MNSKKQPLHNKDQEFIDGLNLSDSVKNKIALRMAKLTNKIAALDRETYMKERAKSLYSWQNYAQKNPKMADREEKFRLSLRPSPLGSLVGINEESMNVLRENIKIEDLTQKYRSNMKSFTPMKELDKRTPKPLIDNLRMIDIILTSSTKKGAFAVAKPGSGKTTAFTDLLPVMAAELALNWKHLWWTAPEGTEFNKFNLARYPIREQRFLFGGNQKALAGYAGDSGTGGPAAAYDHLKAVIENNPNEVCLVFDEIADALAKVDTSVSGGSGSNQAFVTFIKNTNSGGGTGAYKYKLFGLFASEDRELFLEKGEKTYFDEQMQQRVSLIDFKELPWDNKIVVSWLKSVIGFFGKEASYSPPPMGYLTSEVRQKLMQNNNEVMALIAEKAEKAFYKTNLSPDDVKQPSVQRSVSSTVGAIFETYKFRINSNTDYLEVRKLIDKRNDLKNQLGKIKKEITTTDVELQSLGNPSNQQGDQQGDQQQSQAQNGQQSKPGQPKPSSAPVVDDISSDLGGSPLSPRESGSDVLSQEDRQIMDLGSQSQRAELEGYLTELVEMEKAIIKQITIINKRAMEISKNIVNEMSAPKYDNLLNKEVSGDFVADDLSDFQYLKKIDVVDTEKSLIIKVDNEKSRKNKTVEFSEQTEFPGSETHDDDDNAK